MDGQLRQLVRTRAAYLSEYCRLSQEFSELRFHIEHIIPRQHGGADDADNLALACPECNLHGVWDSSMIQHSRMSRADYAQHEEELITAEKLDIQAGGTPEHWANDP